MMGRTVVEGSLDFMACFNNAMVGNKSLDCIIMSLVTCCNQRLTVCLLPGFRCVWGCAPCEDSL